MSTTNYSALIRGYSALIEQIRTLEQIRDGILRRQLIEAIAEVMLRGGNQNLEGWLLRSWTDFESARSPIEVLQVLLKLEGEGVELSAFLNAFGAESATGEGKPAEGDLERGKSKHIEGSCAAFFEDTPDAPTVPKPKHLA